MVTKKKSQVKQAFNLDNLYKSITSNQTCKECGIRINNDFSGNTNYYSIKQVYDSLKEVRCVICGEQMKVESFNVYQYDAQETE